MNLVSQDPFNSIIAYLPDLFIIALKCASKLMANKVKKAENNNYYWKEHTEIVLGKKLKDRELVHWKEIYNILSASDKTKLIIASIKHNNSDALSILIEAGIDPSNNNKSVMIE